MSDDRGETIDLVYIGRTLEQLISEVTMMREQVTVLTASQLRQEAQLKRMIELTAAMAREIERSLDQLDERGERGFGPR